MKMINYKTYHTVKPHYLLIEDLLHRKKYLINLFYKIGLYIYLIS